MNITNADRAAICRDGWNNAYIKAIFAVEPVRTHIGDGLREAWAAFRQARAEGLVVRSQTAAYEEEHGRCCRAEARVYLRDLLVAKSAAAVQTQASVEFQSAHDARQVMRRVLEARIAHNEAAVSGLRKEIERDVATFGMAALIDRRHDGINHLYQEGRNLLQELCNVDRGGVELSPAKQYGDPLAARRIALRRSQELGVTREIERLVLQARNWCDGSADPDCFNAAVKLEHLWLDREKIREQINSAEYAERSKAARSAQVDLVDWLAQAKLSSSENATSKSTPTVKSTNQALLDRLENLKPGTTVKIKNGSTYIIGCRRTSRFGVGTNGPEIAPFYYPCTKLVNGKRIGLYRSISASSIVSVVPVLNG